METSQQTELLDAALALAQAEMQPALKDASNPHFKSKYADFCTVREVARPVLGKHGISVTQEILSDVERSLVGCRTRVAHKSGQWIKLEPLWMKPAKGFSPQEVGSCATYLKRYTYQAALGIAAQDDDDDGETASGRGKGEGKYRQNDEPAFEQSKFREQADANKARIEAMVSNFSKIGVTKEELEEKVGKKTAEFDEETFKKAREHYKTLFAANQAAIKAGLEA